MTSQPTSMKDHAANSTWLASPTPVMDDAAIADAQQLSMARLRPPLRVPGYEQETFLGRGAFGEVWKAVDSNSGRVVAIKFYNRRGGLDWSHMSREVEKLQYLFSDRHVVQLFDVGWEANPPYYVMEYMPYGSLEDRLQQGPLPINEAVAMARNIALGLVGAHDRGILHCDLKPDNIMLDEEGKPRLADFGQSRLKHEHAPAVGTLFYMAPEQAELSTAPDAQWDVYALGAIFYRMLTGRLPYLDRATSQDISSQSSIEQRLSMYCTRLKSAPAPRDHYRVAGVDTQLAHIVDRCLAVNPKHRYPNVQSVLHSLALRESKRAQRPLLLLGILGPMLAVLVLSVVSIWLFNRTLQTARVHLLSRTCESNQFAAQSVASRFALDIDRRWQILQREAEETLLQDWLQADSLPQDIAQTPPVVAEWLQARREYWNSQFSEQTTASYWYILDARGRLRALMPSSDELIGRYFGYREYFHGQGYQLSESGPTPAPIAQPHRSNVFRSKPTNRPAVSLSVPIVAKDDRTIGVLVMETALGHFADFQGSRNQTAALVDLRPDEADRRGLIVEHPGFDHLLATHHYLDEYYVDATTLAALDAILAKPARAPKAMQATELQPHVLTGYHDPVGNGDQDLLAVAEPIRVPRGARQVADSGWVLLVQENKAATLAPIDHLTSMVVYGSMSALGMVIVLLAALWWLVVFVQNAPSRLRASQLWTGHLTDSGTSISGGSAGNPAAAQATPTAHRT